MTQIGESTNTDPGGVDPGGTDAAAPLAGVATGRGRRRRRLRIIGAVLVVLIGGGIAAGKLSAGPTTAGAAPLPPAPRFSLSRLGASGSLSYPSAALAHRPLVLVLFASWCGPCQKELPVVARYVRRLQGTGTPVQFIGVDGNDSNASGLAFARRSGVTFPAVADHQESVALQEGLEGLPDTIFISSAGKVVHITRGAVSVPTLQHWVHVLSAPAKAA